MSFLNSTVIPYFRKRSFSGFSLIDLMVTILIMALLSTMAIPAMSSWIDSVRARSAQKKFYSMATEARSIALRQSQITTLCNLQADECAYEFDLPVTLFVDSDSDAELDFDEEIIRIVDLKLPEKINIRWNRSRYMRFWPSGGTGALNGSLSYCDLEDTGNDFRVVVSRTGRVRIDTQDSYCD